MDDEKQLRRSKRKERRSRKTSKRKEERKERSKRKERRSRKTSKRPRSRFGETLQQKTERIAKERGIRAIDVMYQIARDPYYYDDNTSTARTPSNNERALVLSRNSGQKYKKPVNPESSTYTVSRTEFETTIQDLHNSMTRLQRDTKEHIQNLQNELIKTKKEAMLKSLYSYVIVNDKGIFSYGGSELLLSPKYFYLTDKIMLVSSTNNNNTPILRMFPNIRSLYFNTSITSPIDFRGLEKIESLSIGEVIVPIDLSPLINLKHIMISSDMSSFNNIKESLKELTKLKYVSCYAPLTPIQLTESLKELTKLKYVSLNSAPLTPIQLREYGIIYDTSHQYERDDILKDYIYDDEDYEIEPIDRNRDGAGAGAVLPS